MGDELLVVNGINGATGGYLLPPMPPERISKIALGQAFDPDHIRELRWRHHQTSEAFFGPREGIDPKKLAEAGWGVIFAHDADAAIKESLGELLGHRQREAASVHEHFYREFSGSEGYRPGESKQQFLARHGAGPGPADPDKIPYYLLIVGDPESIPYSFQYQLDVQYAVGRIHFDTLDEYTAYADSILAAETGPTHQPRRVTFFATRNPGDRATALSAAQLVTPLAEDLAKRYGDWAVEHVVGEQATKQRLADVLCGGDPPALLFTASHGVAFPPGHPRQRGHQGALLCQDWQGPGGREEEVHPDCYFSADDLGAETTLRALISFHFACFGGGTPAWEDFTHDGLGHRRRLAPRAFLAGLPKRLLGRPGGAVAVVGHVERAWGYSFLWPGAGRQTETYEDCLTRLLDGHPVGSAFEYLNERYAELSSDLTIVLEDIKYGARPDHAAIATMWTASNDARNLAIVGDPAVRLRLGDAEDVSVPIAPAVALHPPTASSASSAGATPLPPDVSADVDFGMLDGVKRARERVSTALEHVAQSLGSALERAGESMAALEVATYVADDPGSVRYDTAAKRFQGPAMLRAFTRVEIAGDTQVLVPEHVNERDEALWALHSGMVEQARTARQELLKTVTSAMAGLIDALKVL